MKERLLGPLCARWKWFATVVRVQGRFGEAHGGNLAAAVTLAAFTSIFPLLLLAVAVVGYLSLGNASDLPGDVIARLGLTGDAADAVVSAIGTAERSRNGALGLGTLGLIWSSLGLVAALQYAFDSVWQVTGRGVRDKLRALAWLGGTAAIVAGSVGVMALLRLSPWLAPVTIVAGLGINFVLWMWALKMLLNVELPWRSMVPGAVVGAVGLEGLKLLGSLYVPRVVASSSALYGSIGVVFAILAWLFVFGRLAVYVAVINVVRWEEDHGTVTVGMDVPRYPEVVAVGANRAGEVEDPVRSA